MSLKTIKVNPDLLSLAGGGSGGSKSSSMNTKTRKQKPSGVSLTQSNNVKKKLIARIKHFQQKPSSSFGGGGTSSSFGTSSSSNHDEGTTSNSLTESIDFLNNLAREKDGKKKEKRAIRRETLKHPRQPTDPSAYMSIATELPPELSLAMIKPAAPYASVPPIAAPPAPVPPVAVPPAPVPYASAQAPPYSNLKKGGSKPTYRTWLRNTQKIKPTIQIPAVLPTIRILDTPLGETKKDDNDDNDEDKQIVTATESVAAAAALVPAALVPAALVPAPAPAPPPYKPSFAPKRKRIMRTLKYKLGKHANGTVSVLIKNSQTRRKIQNEQSLLKQKSILDIKNYLRKNNLLKVGTQAPNDVLRHLYEQSILAGQVENKSKDNLIHNYFNNDVPNENK